MVSHNGPVPNHWPEMKLALSLTALIAALIAYGTLSPPGPPGPQLYPIDKLLHFSAFALLTISLGWTNPRHALWLIPAAILYGGAIELVQPFVARSGEWLDLVADTAGALTGLVPGLIRTRLRPA